jgi:glyceraldehyde 3-phosphate dehydrogenase
MLNAWDFPDVRGDPSPAPSSLDSSCGAELLLGHQDRSSRVCVSPGNQDCTLVRVSPITTMQAIGTIEVVVSVSIGINGLGRIGQALMRIISTEAREDIYVAAINDIAPVEKMAYALRRDSIRGRFDGTIDHAPGKLIVNEVPIPVFNHACPTLIPWKCAGADVVIDATGRFRDGAIARQHITHGGARKVIISASAINSDAILVYGANHHTYDPARHDVISPASCGVNALSVLARALLDRFDLREVHTCVVLPIQAWQKTQDSVVGTSHDDPRLGRSAANLIPHDHVAGNLLQVALPELGELTYSYYCAPTQVGALAEFVAHVGRPVSVAEVNEALADAADGPLRGVLHYDTEPTVSSDVAGDPASCLVDPSGTQVTADGRIKVRGFFDNEWGFAHRLLDLACLVG